MLKRGSGAVRFAAMRCWIASLTRDGLSVARLSVVGLSVAGLFVAGCAPSAPSVPYDRIPLAAFAAAFELQSETAAIDLGAPSAKEFLLEGWGPPEPGPAGVFRWGAGPLSRIRFESSAASDLEVRLRGWSYPFGDGPAQRVETRLNGQKLDERELLPASTSWAVEIPAERLVAGENLLELAYSRWNERPGEAPWAAAWDGLRFVASGRPRANAAPSAVEIAGDSITLPVGSSLAATIELPKGARLAWDAVERTGDASVDLLAELEEAPPPETATVAARVEGARRAGTLPLTPSSAGLARFSLHAHGEEGGVVVRGLRLEQPRLAESSSPRAASEPAIASGSAPAAPRPDIVLYIIDTLRADHLGCYGYERPTSPRIDRFAAESWLFRQGRAQSSWTKPAVASILTGLYPPAHGAEGRSQRIHESVETLAERMQRLGYETAFFTTNANVSGRFGFNQGWNEYRYLTHRSGRKHRHLEASEMNREVFAWLAGRTKRAARPPFFLVVHTLDPHDPYRPREEFRARLAPSVDVEPACCGRSTALAELRGEEARRRAADAMALYDAEIAQNDAAFGDLLDELDRRGLGDRSVVLLTADHGEEFFDHGGWKHGYTLYEEMLRVPMILRLPAEGGGRSGRASDLPADQVDIATTLLALVGAPPAPELPGKNLLANFADRPEGSFPASFAWLDRPGAESAAVTAAGWKLVRFSGDPGERGAGEAVRNPQFGPEGTPARALFELAEDPGERTNRLELSRRRTLRERWLAGRLDAAMARYGGHEAAEDAEIDPELEKSLRALGYF